MTRARSKKKSKEPALKQIVVDLDPSEEVKIIMDQRELNEPPTQDMDTGKEPEGEMNPMSTLTIVNSHSTQTTPSSKEPPRTPQWLEASIRKKCSVVPIIIPMKYMVSKCLGKVSKPKKLKTQTMLEVDEATCHWTVEIDKPIPDRDSDKATEDDFNVEKLIWGFLHEQLMSITWSPPQRG